MEPLWAVGDDGRGIGRRVKDMSLKVLLFLVRRYHALFGSVLGVPTDVMVLLLLARTVDRRIGATWPRTPTRTGWPRRRV